MKIIVVENFDEMSRKGADWLVDIVHSKPNASVVFAMGNSPMGMYAELTKSKEAGEVDFSHIKAFQLDGYLGITRDDPRSLEGWLRRSVVEPLELREDQLVVLNENASDPAADCAEYERQVEEVGGYDATILGLGPNGHLGFNEPPSSSDSLTRVVTLTEKSLISNANYWGGIDLVPRQSVTAGMKALLASKQILLLVSGKHKQEILRQMVRCMKAYLLAFCKIIRM
jgi:glucosamine-6-phosphate deaminase